MFRRAAIALTLAALAVSGPITPTAAQAAAPKPRPVTDCPLRDAPFSADSPLIDVLLSPAAKAIVQKEGGKDLAKAPAMFTSTTPPSFAAILTFREAAGMTGQPAEAVARADAALARVRVTPRDKIARCARYDADLPALEVPAGGKPRVLLFEKINGFKDVPGFDAAHAAFLAMAKDRGWAIVATDSGGAFTPATLAQVDVVIWNNVSGDVLTLAQRAAFQNWMEQGGGFVGVHGSGGDPMYFWDWYADTLIGARFAGHPMDPQFQDAWVRTEQPAHPVARGLPSSWLVYDEWYSFKASPRASGSRIVATLDEKTYKPVGRGGQDLKMGDHPIAWTRCVGKGRSFYSAIGHVPERYADSEYRRMLAQAVIWVADKGGRDCPR